MRKFILAGALLLSGLAVYWLFRPDILFFEVAGIGNPHPLAASSAFLVAVKNHFADAAWCAAVFLIAGCLREQRFSRFYADLLVVLPFLSEALQALRIIPGTFDWIDLAIYAALLALLEYREVVRMNQYAAHVAGVTAVGVFSLALLGSGSGTPPPRQEHVYETGTFTLAQRSDDIFVKPSFGRILRQSGNLAVVLRVPVSGEKVTEQERQASSSLYNTIDKELAKAGYVVRDRALFARVLEQSSLDYTRIGQLTQTDLILEIVGYRSEKYSASRYKNAGGEEKTAPTPISFTGSSVEIKVISVKENDLVASFTYHYTPCTKGCSHRFSATVTNSWASSAGNPSSSELRDALFLDFALKLVKQLDSRN